MISITEARIQDASAAGILEIEVLCSNLAFDPDIEVFVLLPSGSRFTLTRFRSQHDIPWLSSGRYLFTFRTGAVEVLKADIRVVASSRVSLQPIEHAALELAGTDNSSGERPVVEVRGAWDVQGLDGRTKDRLSTRRGHEDWFFRHFDHAARTVISYMLGDSPLLRGRILDLGCGDGITDFGIALRCQPEVLVGLDPFRGFDRLPAILDEVDFPVRDLPGCLRFVEGDGNHLPFPDDSFDVVVSWGSVEHIAGGYLQTLREVKRVLRPDGLLFIHPGLFYSNIGHHLGEFSDEPFFHLKRSHEDLRDFVLGTKPNYIDRSGYFATPEEYWRWYCELNPITVDRFEDELRALEFEPWRVAIRTADRVEYTPELQRYRMQDLATNELYVSCYNRKKSRPPGFRMRDPVEA